MLHLRVGSSRGWQFPAPSMWAGVEGPGRVRKRHGGIWSSEVRSRGETAEEGAQLGSPVFR